MLITESKKKTIGLGVQDYILWEPGGIWLLFLTGGGKQNIINQEITR